MRRQFKGDGTLKDESAFSSAGSSELHRILGSFVYWIETSRISRRVIYEPSLE